MGESCWFLESCVRWSPVLEGVILGLICLTAFFLRLFAVIRYESVIHEFDPHFNYRVSQFLVEHGFYEFWNWFDDRAWYPLARYVGRTLYPGLMATSGVFFHVLRFFGFFVNIRNICVFMGPVFSGFTALAAYGLAKEVSGRPEAGLFAALFMGTCPSYLSRSVAGSYDNEAVAIFALTFSFFAFVKAVNVGERRILWSLLAAVAYLYMVSTWGGYVFVLNTIAIYIAGLLVLGRFYFRHYVVYAVFYVMGTVFCLNFPFVHFQAMYSSEHMASHGVFLATTAVMLVRGLKELVTPVQQQVLLRGTVTAVVGGFCCVFAYLSYTGKSYWSGRSLTLLDPTYASKYIPIIASVSEHQPTSWSNYIMDLYLLPLFTPVGLVYAFCGQSDGSTPESRRSSRLFLGIYGVLAAYFSGVMIRLLLVLAPAASCLAGLGVAVLVSSVLPELREEMAAVDAGGGRGLLASLRSPVRLAKLGLVAFVGFELIKYVCHATSMSSLAYSSPSIVMSGQRRDGSRLIQDDFREAYYWLRMNTAEDAKILSWWDYGYQIASIANRTTVVDNNTANNTHIATVGLVLASTEDDALPILNKLDVDYVLVLYGGVARYSSDDINKFLWPVRIASGVYPHLVQEADFIGPRGYTVDESATEKMKNSVIYKLSYYRAGELTRNQDYARNQPIGRPQFPLKHFEEAFTSQNWIVRIYRVKRSANRVSAPIHK